MSNKHQLRDQRNNTVINKISKYQEKECDVVIANLIDKIEQEMQVVLHKESQIFLKDIVKELKDHFDEPDFHYYFDSSSMRPDGGLLYLLDNKKEKYPILITEVKNQGTNDLRVQEGKSKQAKGNAIERLGKNVIGLRTYLLKESIFPFVCFGYGCDFNSESSILDRVATIAMFGKLNNTYLHNTGLFNRGSFYFREQKWTEKEMFEILYDIAKSSIYYYFSKYGEEIFKMKKNK